MNELKTALVTGADRGLGINIARELAANGFRVFAGKYLEDYPLLDQLKEEFPELYPVKLDVTKHEEMEAARDRIAEVSGRLDLLVSNAALMSANGSRDSDIIDGNRKLDTGLLEQFFMTNSYAAPLLTDVMLPLLEKGEMKRLFFTSSEISSVRLMRRTGNFRYGMTKTALNLGVRMIYNELRPKGYTFRLYQPGWMRHQNPDGSFAPVGIVDPKDSAKEAVRQMLSDRPDEDRLVLTDYLGRELSY